MSPEFDTKFGRLRRVSRDGVPAYLLLCPGCGEWGTLDDDQLHGRISVDHASMGCSGGYHETHDFWAEIEGAGEDGDHPAYTEDPEMRQIAESLGTRWLEFYEAVHSGGTATFITDGVDELMRSLALREAAIDHYASMKGDAT